MATRGKKKEREDDGLAREKVLAAFEKLFGKEGRGVRRFERSGLRYVRLTDDTVLVEQNPKKSSVWAELALRGHRVAWAIREGEYLARVVDGEVEMLQGR
jgi:hypothetical protein